MESYFGHCNKDSMKMAILMHEKTFKEQVSELHRLYRIQKHLMKEMARGGLQECSSKKHNLMDETSSDHMLYCHKDQMRTHRTIDLERAPEEYIEDEVEDQILETEQESDTELTLGWGFNPKKIVQTSRHSDSGLTFSSSSVDSSTMDKKSMRSSSKMGTRENVRGHDIGIFQMPNRSMSFQTHEKNIPYGVQEQIKQERVLNQSPWLVHALSLNLT